MNESRFETPHVPPVGAMVMKRFPLQYDPTSATQLNASRLPHPLSTADMSLAHRCEPWAADRAKHAVDILGLMPTGMLVMLVLSISVTRIAPFYVAIGLAGLVATLMLVLLFRAGLLSPRYLLIAVLAPAMGIALLYAVSSVIDNRLLVTAVLASISAILFRLLGTGPVSFYQQWILTHPRLTPPTRKALSAERAPAPMLWPLYLTLVIAVLLPRYSSALATLLIAALNAGVVLWWLRGRAPLRGALDALGHYLAYGRDDAGAPGVWRPRDHQRRRHWTFVTLLSTIFFTLGLGLTLYVPGDVARSGLSRLLVTGASESLPIRKVFDHSTSPVDWDKAPPPLVPTVNRPQLPEIKPSDTLRNWKIGADERAARLNERVQRFSSQADADDDRFRRRYVARAFPSFVRDEIGDRPHTWLFAVLAAILQGRLHYGWLLPVSLLLAATLPSLVLLAVYARPLAFFLELRHRVEGSSASPGLDHAPDRTEWDWRVDRVAESVHTATEPLFGSAVYEADHLFLGVEPCMGFPVLLHRPLLNQHCYIVGETGSGKTSLGIMPMLIQLLRQHIDPSREDSARSEPPIVILDLKGDPALLQTIKAEADARRERHGVTDPNDPHYAFRLFTPEMGAESHHFNPFASMDSKRRSPMQLCELILDSLALSHGEGYGRSYYTRRNRMMLYEALQDPAKPRSFEELYQVLERLARREGAADVFELAATVQSLSRYKNLASDGSALPESATIHLPTALEHRQVVYFWLPAALESVSVREIAKLALYSLLTAAIDRQRDRTQDRETYLFIDEFQRIAGENFRIILEQARSFGVRAILANQSISDLKTPDTDLRPAIRTNTRVKMHFSVSDPGEMEDLCTISGEELAISQSVAWRFDSVKYRRLGDGSRETMQMPRWSLAGMTESTTLKSRLTKSDIIRTSDHPQEFILHVSQGSGYTQFGGVPIPVQTRWPIPFSVYKRRAMEPWPNLGRGVGVKAAVQKQSPRQIDDEAQVEFLKRTRPLAESVYRELERQFGPTPVEAKP